MENEKAHATKEPSRSESSYRPLSHYDNEETENNREKTSSNNNVSNKGCTFSGSPSQTHCLNTTVPQNITKQDIAGKHTPTRNSLRHSRMIVLNRSGQVTSGGIPFFVKYINLVRSFRVIIFILGLLLCVLSLWLLLWTPNLKSKDNPYWSALPVLISGIFGIIFINTCPKVYSQRNVTLWKKSIKYISITTSTVAVVASLIVFILSTIHLITQTSTVCAPLDKLNITCVCKTNSTENDVNTIYSSYHYVDLTCNEVNNVLSIMIMFTCTSNGVIVILELTYLYLHWASRKIFFYGRVHTDENALKVYKTNR